MTKNQLKTLRNRKVLNVWDCVNKYFVKIQLNKDSNFLCWERWVSKDSNNWTNHNLYLDLHDVDNILKDYADRIKLQRSL